VRLRAGKECRAAGAGVVWQNVGYALNDIDVQRNGAECGSVITGLQDAVDQGVAAGADAYAMEVQAGLAGQSGEGLGHAFVVLHLHALHKGVSPEDHLSPLW
jgi:hypothetical protein